MKSTRPLYAASIFENPLEFLKHRAATAEYPFAREKQPALQTPTISEISWRSIMKH